MFRTEGAGRSDRQNRIVAGYLRPEEAGPFFDARLRPAEIPMIAPLSGRLRPEAIPPDRAFFGHLDHF